ncbi:MAG: hypothetical protein II317_02630 [Clostridia bacterium]|nr:hypothetical protein [Clostridia bacterium]
MGKFIEEFYYGNLDPQARSTKQNKAVQKQMEVLMLNEDYLTENLSGENKKKFLEFVNAWKIKAFSRENWNWQSLSELSSQTS